MLDFRISRINAIRIYIVIAVLANLIFSIIRPELESEYTTAGFQMLALFLVTFI